MSRSLIDHKTALRCIPAGVHSTSPFPSNGHRFSLLALQLQSQFSRQYPVPGKSRTKANQRILICLNGNLM